MESKHEYLHHLPDAGTAIDRDADYLDYLLDNIDKAEEAYLKACTRQLAACREEGWTATEIEAAMDAARYRKGE